MKSKTLKRYLVKWTENGSEYSAQVSAQNIYVAAAMVENNWGIGRPEHQATFLEVRN